MSRTNLYATTALGLCLVATPLPGAAQTAADLPAHVDPGIFAPLVQECVVMPTAAACEGVGTLIQDCAEELDYAACEVLFVDADEVFADPQTLAWVEERLQEVSGEIEGMDAAAAPVVEADAITLDTDEDEELDESVRAAAERTLLRGDENLMSHSSPTLLEGEVEPEELEAVEREVEPTDADVADAVPAPVGTQTEPVAEVMDDEPVAAPEPVTAQAAATGTAPAPQEQRVQVQPAEAPAEEAEPADAPEPVVVEADTTVEAEVVEADPAAEPVEAEVVEADPAAEPLEAEVGEADPATEPVEAEVVDTQPAEPVEAEVVDAEPAETAEETVVEVEPAAPVEEDAAEADPAEPAEEVVIEAEPSPAPEAPAAEVTTEEERERDALRERMRAEAEDLGEEAPQYIVEEAPAEEFVPPAEEAPQIGAAQQQELERMVQQDPEIAAALAVLGGALATPAEDEVPEQRRQRAGGAVAALLRERGEMQEQDVAAAPAEAEVTEDRIEAGEVRRSGEDFATRLSLDFQPEQIQLRRDRGRDWERAGLAALAGLAVGMVIERNRVVARGDDRIVVDRGQGDLAIWRDDDVILRQEGVNRRIERYEDGSTLTRWDRPDGSQVITIRDATGRVLWRERVLADGTSIQLVDDMRDDVQPVDIRMLPPPATRELRITQRTDPDLAIAMLRDAEADVRALDRGFTLHQIREYREVREMVPLLSPEPITFETNRANVRPEEAPKLAQVGRLMERLIAENPREVFLVEGHTDATGPAAFNLGLSDRRAESVALALTEFFDIPPENLVIQGYGERHLRIPTLAAEERNRRVAIRRITPLMGHDI